MKIFTPTRKTKTGAFILFVVMALCTGGLAYISYLSSSLFYGIRVVFGNNSSLSPFAYIWLSLCSLPTLLFFLLTLWTWVSFMSIRKARLIFEDRAITFEFNPRLPSYRNRGLKPFSIPYEQVKTIKGFGETGALEISDLEGKKHLLAPVMFGKNYGENVLTELRTRLPSEKLGTIANYSEVQKKWLKEYRRASIPLLICAVAYFVTLFFDPMISSRPWINAWQVEFRPPWLESVWRYSPDTQGNFWVIGHHIQYYRIYLFPDETSREWNLPDSVLGGDYPDAASQDATGTPIVWANEKVFHYTNGNWQVIPIQNNLEYIDWERSGVVEGEQAWAVTQTKQLVKIDALSGTWAAIPLPETATILGLDPVSLRRSIQGDILVLMEKDTDSRVYLYKDGTWKSQEYNVFLPDENMVMDYCLDEDGALWVLFTSKAETIVEKIDISGEFHWTVVPAPTDIENWRYYEKVFVDTHGRMWVTSSSYPPFITVFQPIWEGNAIKLVRYTRGNSNYKEDVFNSPTLLADGQILGFDNVITSMDTNQENLPSPLPDWFGNLDWNLIRLFITPFQLLASIYLLIVSRKWTQRLKQGN